MMKVLDDPHGLERRRYGALSIGLHWTIALLIFVQMGLGWWMNELLPDHSPAQDQMQDIHVSLGLTTLILVLARIATRLVVPMPELPRGFPRWERRLARAMHLLFYVLMLMLPLTGWALVTVRHEPFSFWGLHWPALPGLEGGMGPAHKAFRQALKHFHVFTEVWIAWVMIGLHVAGAIKHQFDGHPVLWRMIPGLKPDA
jgi:cytochrome b561